MTLALPPNAKAFGDRIISVYIHEQYVYGTEENANVVPFRPKIRVQFSRNPWEDIRFRRYVRIYIIIERKERFPSSTDCFPLRPRYFIRSLFFRPNLSSLRFSVLRNERGRPISDENSFRLFSDDNLDHSFALGNASRNNDRCSPLGKFTHSRALRNVQSDSKERTFRVYPPSAFSRGYSSCRARSKRFPTRG